MEIGRRIFTIWFHLNPLPFFSRHPSKESSLHRVSSRKCVCPCVRRPHSTNSTSRSLESRKKRCPFILAHLQSLSSSIVIKRGKVATGWRRKRNGKDEKGVKGSGSKLLGKERNRAGLNLLDCFQLRASFLPFPLPTAPPPSPPPQPLMSPLPRFVAVKRRPTMVCGVEPIPSIPDAPRG